VAADTHPSCTGEQLEFEYDEQETDINVKNYETFLTQPAHPSLGPLPPELSSPPVTPRRELRWRSLEQGALSLEGVSYRFRNLLVASSSSAHPSLRRIRVQNTRRILHRCVGYTREEITLSADILYSAIVSHTIPSPREICIVCGEPVQETGKFDCVCGEDGAQTDYLVCTSIDEHRR
jgi:hypothetical protein